ncbi:hypothetical protein EDD90_10654 [Streptomyces sp. Ag109_O5-1]|uniref:hypothetical protein n=1 Tax=Streptomyces sp. Ag109_O5-1 TaxID=1938851 RepID=UPI000FAFE2D4|nr:hypothetical protein [Streptomyces sp. Ag109_O5-1]RPE47201.1 hypothetical protein EDD90_10654 [Streptomyces sp. Ag109_O5-1]
MIEDSRKISDARLVAGRFDGFTALDWIRQAVSVTSALAAWDQDQLVDVAVGKHWDVVRLPRALGWRTVERMRHEGTPVGPVQHTPEGVEVLVPVGSAAEWHLPDTEVLTEGTVAVPHPAMVAPRTQHAHTWIVSPQECAPLTDANLLHEAYAAALAATHMDSAR